MCFVVSYAKSASYATKAYYAAPGARNLLEDNQTKIMGDKQGKYSLGSLNGSLYAAPSSLASYEGNAFQPSPKLPLTCSGCPGP